MMLTGFAIAPEPAPPTVAIPEGHVIVATQPAEDYDGQRVATIGASVLYVVLRNPDRFRVVPDSLPGEYAVMLAKHKAEVAAFWDRVCAMPKFKIAVSIEASVE